MSIEIAGLADIAREHARQRPDTAAIVHRGRTTSYADLDQAAAPSRPPRQEQRSFLRDAVRRPGVLSRGRADSRRTEDGAQDRGARLPACGVGLLHGMARSSSRHRSKAAGASVGYGGAVLHGRHHRIAQGRGTHQHELPKSVDFIDVLPRNPTGKILKRELRKTYWGDKQRQVN